MSTNFKDLPVDAESAELLSAQGLRLGLVDTSDEKAFGAWLQADMRGFHSGRIPEAQIAEHLRGLAYRRTTAIWDDSLVDAAAPVATVSSWPAELTLPGERGVAGWAISSVTVAPTHRRKGIARSLLESELRAANELGLPLAMLTVSESTIYGRFGFGPAAMGADWTIDTRRAKWIGPVPEGRVQFLELAELRAQAPAIIERVRSSRPGEVETWEHLWDRMFALSGDDNGLAKKLRGVRYDDANGEPQGFALYHLKGGDDDFSAHSLHVQHLVSATDDAYAGLWRYLLEVDLVTEVRAWLRSVDEPLAWQVSDFRSARRTIQDHLWLRILDVPAALEARRYSADGTFALELSDPLGYADGRYLVSVADGAASVDRLDGELPSEVPALALSVNELGSIYLGGVSARTLQRSGRIAELREGSADAVDAAFRSPITPWLSIWF